MNSATPFDGSESIVVSNSTVSMSPSPAAPVISTPTLHQEQAQPQILPPPSSTSSANSSQLGQLNVSAIVFSELPLYRLVGLDPSQMTTEQQRAYVERIRELRKSPQSLGARLKKDGEILDAEHGVGAAATIKAKRTKQSPAPQAQAPIDVNKYLNF